jgi:hypothetical protein
MPPESHRPQAPMPPPADPMLPELQAELLLLPSLNQKPSNQVLLKLVELPQHRHLCHESWSMMHQREAEVLKIHQPTHPTLFVSVRLPCPSCIH